MNRTRLVAVGACAIDTILTVPYFPHEDSKLRATGFSKRRGGNCPNTLEVLQQLVSTENDNSIGEVELFLIATLPSQTSAQVASIAGSFDHDSTAGHTNTINGQSASRRNARVNLTHCIYRENFTEPVSSYIISTPNSASRTIINHNALPEMSTQEFISRVDSLLQPTTFSESTDAGEQVWLHFEGRIPETTLECMRYVRKQNPDLKISIELEKPGRPGLQKLAYEANVVFYSRSWAEGEGYHDAEHCLRKQANILQRQDLTSSGDRLLVCTWGAAGASATVVTSSSALEIVHSPAYVSTDRPVVDTTGAGDTFIAGALFGLMCNYRSKDLDSGAARQQSWSLQETMEFANGLAGRKILQQGFRLGSVPDMHGSES